MATFITTPSKDIVLCLTKAEASGLSILALEGASAILNDREIARSILGSHRSMEAAKSALDAIRSAAENTRIR